MFFNEAKTLIVVYEDEMLSNQVKKLVETKDDKDSESIVGTKDGTIKIVSWSEKVWIDQKKSGTIDSKILFIGDIKDSGKLIPIVDIKFDDFGVKYGWAGNQGIVWCDPKEISDEETYKKFIDKVSILPIPAKWKEDVNKPTSEFSKENPSNSKNKILNFLHSIGDSITGTAKEVFINPSIVKKQMLFYGVLTLYNNDLETFMQS